MLNRENMWFTGGAIRSQQVKLIKGGLSAAFKHWVKLFVAPLHNFEKGVTCHFGDGSVRLLFAKLSGVVADEDALRGMFRFKGSAGIKPCFKCCNLVSVRSNLDGDGAVGCEQLAWAGFFFF